MRLSLSNRLAVVFFAITALAIDVNTAAEGAPSAPADWLAEAKEEVIDRLAGLVPDPV